MRRSVFNVALLAIAALWPAWTRAGDQEDKQFAQQIAAVIRGSGRVQNYSIGVKCKDGTVWLAGRVTSSEQMDAALDVVENVDGVEQIVNNLAAPAAGGAKVSVSAPAATPRAIANAPAEQSTQAAPVQLASAAVPAPMPRQNVPAGYSRLAQANYGGAGRPIPAYAPTPGGGIAPASYDQPHMPNYAWPSYAPYPNYASLTYPRQYSPTAWPFIGPFYPYPQVPMGWRKVSLEWDDGWWFLDFQDRSSH